MHNAKSDLELSPAARRRDRKLAVLATICTLMTACLPPQLHVEDETVSAGDRVRYVVDTVSLARWAWSDWSLQRRTPDGWQGVDTSPCRHPPRPHAPMQPLEPPIPAPTEDDGGLAGICKLDPSQCGTVDLTAAAARPLCQYMSSLDLHIENPGDLRDRVAALPADLPDGTYRLLVRFRRYPWGGSSTVDHWGQPVNVTSNAFDVVP